MTEIQDQIEAAAQRKGAHRDACPFCHQQAWSPGEEFFLVPVDRATTEPTGMKVAAVVCTHCGFIRLHQTSFLGI
jgi:hypothetical protein